MAVKTIRRVKQMRKQPHGPKGVLPSPQRQPPGISKHMQSATQKVKQVQKVVKPLQRGSNKAKAYSWQKKDQQRMSDKYGITTYNVDGTVSTVPQRKESEWWDETIVEDEQ